MVMERSHMERPIQDAAGNLRQGSIVRVLEPGTTTPIAEPLFKEGTGTDAWANPFTSESGVIDFYLDQPKRVRIGVVTPGATDEVFFDDIEVGDPESYKETLAFTLAGAVAVSNLKMRYYVDDLCEVINVRASVGTAPTGGDLVVDLNKNGSSIFDTPGDQPRIAAGTNMAVVDLSTHDPKVTFDAEDYITIDIDQVGVNTPGADLVVQVRVKRLEN